MNKLIFLSISIFFITIAGCGGGGSSTGSTPTLSSDPVASTGATITWTSPSLNEDDTALTDLNGYKVYFGQTTGTYNDTDSPKIIACGDIACDCNKGASCSYLVSDTYLGTGTWYFVLTAVDSTGNESAYSDEVDTTR